MAGVRTVWTVSLLFEGFGSPGPPVTRAELVIVLSATLPTDSTTRVAVADPPGASPARSQVTTEPSGVHIPWVALELTSITTEGRSSTMRTPVAGSGPRLVADNT